jgi:hypothetical protein
MESRHKKTRFQTFQRFQSFKRPSVSAVQCSKFKVQRSKII